MKKKKEHNLSKARKADKREIHVYDRHDTTAFIQSKKKLNLADLNIELPDEMPTKVLSLRMPTSLLNKIKAYAGEQDVPYSAMIKMLLVEGIESKLSSASHSGRR